MNNMFFRTVATKVVSSDLWKTRAKEKGSNEPWKSADTEIGRLSEGLGRCPKNPQGTRPLTRILGSAQTCPRRKQGKVQ